MQLPWFDTYDFDKLVQVYAVHLFGLIPSWSKMVGSSSSSRCSVSMTACKDEGTRTSTMFCLWGQRAALPEELRRAFPNMVLMESIQHHTSFTANRKVSTDTVNLAMFRHNIARSVTSQVTSIVLTYEILLPSLANILKRISFWD